MSETPENDDAAWFAALTGRRPAAGAPSPAAAEGTALRAALLSLDREEAASERLDADWQRLRFRLRREGLVGARRQLAGWALAASLCLAVGVAWLYPRAPVDVPESQVLRGAPAPTLVLRVADPAAAADYLLKLCRDAGIPARRRDDSSGAPLLDIDLPPVPPKALRDAFEKYAIDLPPAGKVTLVLMRVR